MTRSEDTPGIQGEGQRPDSNSSLHDTAFDFWGDSRGPLAGLHLSIEDLQDGTVQITIFDFENGEEVFNEVTTAHEMIDAIVMHTRS